MTGKDVEVTVRVLLMVITDVTNDVLSRVATAVTTASSVSIRVVTCVDCTVTRVPGIASDEALNAL